MNCWDNSYCNMDTGPCVVLGECISEDTLVADNCDVGCNDSCGEGYADSLHPCVFVHT